MRTCSSEDLVCVESLTAGEGGETEECLERCEGTILDVTKLGSARDERVLASFVTDYERYKHRLSANIREGKIVVVTGVVLYYSHFLDLTQFTRYIFTPSFPQLSSDYAR